MAALATELREFSDNGNSRTYTSPGHTSLQPRLVIQKRKIANSSAIVAENDVKVVFGLLDSLGNPLPSKVTFEVTVRSPLIGVGSATHSAALSLFKEIVASDEFADTLLSQNWLM